MYRCALVNCAPRAATYMYELLCNTYFTTFNILSICSTSPCSLLLKKKISSFFHSRVLKFCSFSASLLNSINMSPSPPPPMQVSIPREKPSSKKDDDDDEEEKSNNNNERKKKKRKTKKRNKTGKEKKLKEKFIALIRRKLIENAQFRRNFVKANEYNKVAQSIRVCFREEDKDKEDNNNMKEEREKMLCFLDSKSHFLFVVDKVLFVEKSEEKENTTTTTNDQEKNENEKRHRKEEVKEEEENKYRNHVNLMEPSESWLRVKNYHRNKFEKLGENAALAIKEKQKAKREAKERVNKARMEKKEKETREKERKERKRKYHVDLEYYRYKGTCLDWVNTGMCRFGSECTYTHDETAKGKLIEAAREVEAKTGRDRGLRGEYASAKEESGKKNTRKRGEEKDRKEGEEEEEENERTKGERKRRKREDVLLGDFDDDFDDDKDDTVVPGFLKAKMKQQKEDKEGRPALSIRERKLLKKKREEEEIKAREASNNNKKKKKFDKTKRVLSRKASTDKKVKTIGGGSGMTKKKKKERHPDGRHAKRSKARLEQIQ